MESTDKAYTLLISTLNRSFNGVVQSGGKDVQCGWALYGPTLAHALANRSLEGLADIHVTTCGNTHVLDWIMGRYGHNKSGATTYGIGGGTKLIIHPVDKLPPIVGEFPEDYDRDKLHYPENPGAFLDTFNGAWSENVQRIPKPYPPNIFFTDIRKQNGHDFIRKMLECGKQAGIEEKMFLGFGTALGYALRGDFLPNDNDIDMCIMADEITQDQRHQYLVGCKAAGLTENRMRGPVFIEGKYCWFSIGPLSPYTENGVKSCNWFWFEHGGFLWHSKGKQWIGRSGLNQQHPTAKGILAGIAKGLKKVKFAGIDVQVPANLGRCLDEWYPGWAQRKKEQSAITNILVMPSDDRAAWYIERKEKCLPSQ